jgi:hypothetical protein
MAEHETIIEVAVCPFHSGIGRRNRDDPIVSSVSNSGIRRCVSSPISHERTHGPEASAQAQN